MQGRNFGAQDLFRVHHLLFCQVSFPNLYLRIYSNARRTFQGVFC